MSYDRPYRTAAQHAHDVLMMRRENYELPADFDDDPSAIDIGFVDGNDERGWWRDASLEEVE
jgi:hypothetical protein